MKFKHNENKVSDEKINNAADLWLKELFASIDRMDAKAYADFFTDDASFQMANQPAALGKLAIAGMAQFVFDRLSALRHEIVKRWVFENELFVEGRVFYHTKDSRHLEFPFFSVFELSVESNQKLIRSYRAFIDAHELFLKD